MLLRPISVYGPRSPSLHDRQFITTHRHKGTDAVALSSDARGGERGGGLLVAYVWP